jgi:hypothetical protein
MVSRLVVRKAVSAEEERFVFMDWTTSGKGIESNGVAAYVIVLKPDVNPNSQWSLAVGAGRDGSNALLVEDPNTDGTEEFPEFWIIRLISNGLGGDTLPSDGSHYTLAEADPGWTANTSPNTGYNRIGIWMKFQSGLYNSVASDPNKKATFHLGTYHLDSAVLPTTAFEGDTLFDQHGYYDTMIRHDLIDDGWVQVILNPGLTHQRSHTDLNPWEWNRHYTGTGGHGHFDTLTRFYFAAKNQNSEPEIAGPIQYWVDSIEFWNEPETNTNPMTVDVTSHTDFAVVGYEPDGATPLDVDFNITNDSGSSFTGRVTRTGLTSQLGHVFKEGVTQISDGDEFTWTAFETKDFHIEMLPTSALNSTNLPSVSSSTFYCGINIIPSSEYENVTDTHMSRGLTDNRVEIRSANQGGGTDDDHWHGAPDAHTAGSYVILRRNEDL